MSATVASHVTTTRRLFAACVVLVVVAVVGIGMLQRGDSESSYTPGRIQRIASEEPTWITVKYRSTPVDVGSGMFEYWRPEVQGNVREAWWDTQNDYMLINLGGTVYHYCDLSIYMWREFTTWDSPDSYYDRLIKGYPWMDCRSTSPPNYS